MATKLATNDYGKLAADANEAIGNLPDGSTVVVGGFGDSGIPFRLLTALRDVGARCLTIVSINAGRGSDGISALMDAGRVSRIICSFPRTEGSVAFERAYQAKTLELELVPMGTLVERLRAGGAGIGAFYTRVGVGTLLESGKEVREIGGRPHVLEYAIRPDLALVRAHRADPFGNLVYRGVSRNLNPVAAKAATTTIAEVEEIVALGTFSPDSITTPGVFVDRVVVDEGHHGAE